jgi:hypothetical protein
MKTINDLVTDATRLYESGEAIPITGYWYLQCDGKMGYCVLSAAYVANNGAIPEQNCPGDVAAKIMAWAVEQTRLPNSAMREFYRGYDGCERPLHPEYILYFQFGREVRNKLMPEGNAKCQ